MNKIRVEMPSAPTPHAKKGTPDRALFLDMKIRRLFYEKEFAIEGIKGYYEAFKAEEAFRLLRDAFGQPFDSVKSWVEHPEPHGLGMSVADFEKEMSRKEQKEATKKAVEEARAANPDASKAGIGRKVGKTGQRVGQIENEAKAKSDPKLLKKGENQHTACSDQNKLKSRGETKAYILARLERDGHHDLFLKAKDGLISPRQAGIEAGFIKVSQAIKIGSNPSTDAQRVFYKFGRDYLNEFIANAIKLLEK